MSDFIMSCQFHLSATFAFDNSYPTTVQSHAAILDLNPTSSLHFPSHGISAIVNDSYLTDAVRLRLFFLLYFTFINVTASGCPFLFHCSLYPRICIRLLYADLIKRSIILCHRAGRRKTIIFHTLSQLVLTRVHTAKCSLICGTNPQPG